MRVYYTSPSDFDVCELCGTSFRNPEGERHRFCSRECWKRRPIDHTAKFWARVDKTDGCWLWAGARLPNGYGHMSIRGKHWFPHRYAWTLAHGTIPEGLWVLHRCDTPLCVRPDHLFLGGSAENVRDMWEKGRGKPPAIRWGASHHLAKLDDQKVRAIRTKYAGGGVRYSDLAGEYGISTANIGKVIRRKAWKHVTD